MTVRRKQSILNGRGHLFGYLRREGGNMAAIFAILLVPLVGAMSMGMEASSWFFMSRSAQNAADSAAIAAANNGFSTAGNEYIQEGKANARSYGFTDGSANVTVAVVNGQTCPDGTTGCYKATVTKLVPIYLTRITGYNGDQTVSGQRFKTIVSTAMAEPISKITYPSCMTVTGNAPGQSYGVQTKGSPDASMPGCTISAIGPNSQVSCNGQGISGNPAIFATGSIASACTGGTEVPNGSASAYVDPYSGYYSKIPCSINSASSNCDTSTSPTCAAAGSTLVAGNCYNGTVNLSGNVTLSPTSPNVIYVKNGDINLTDNAVLTASNVTFVFTGATPGGFTGGKKGGIGLTAPSSGTWSGVGAYQDTHLASSSYIADSWSQNGGTPTIDLVGLIYLPRTDVDFGGGAGQTTKTSTCYVAVYHSYSVNGTGLSMTRTGCATAGLNNLPTVQLLRAALVK